MWDDCSSGCVGNIRVEIVVARPMFLVCSRYRGRGMAKRKESHRAITRRAGRRPNALKHGAFSGSVILPGEDPREFEQLVNAVFAEWQPSGPVEEDAARSLASAIWRKDRLGIFLRAQRAQEAADDRWRQENLEEFPILMAKPVSPDSVRSDKKEAPVNVVDRQLVALREWITPEQFLKRMEMEQRLDAKIDRAVKRLLQVKAMKSVVGLGPQSQTTFDREKRALPRPENPKPN
jgi:hypothetical protein